MFIGLCLHGSHIAILYNQFVSSVWENSEPDISDPEARDKATDLSGCCPPIEPLIPVNHSVDADGDISQQSNSLEQDYSKSSPALTFQ